MQASSQLQKPTNPLRYAVGMFGTSIPINMFKTFAAFFYIDKLHLITTPQFSAILLFYTFVDAIDNPIYGFLSDRTRSKWGRRRLWLMLGAPLLVLCFVMFFNPPPFLAPGSGFWYILIMYILTGTLDSLINSNYGALFPELFRTEAERAKTNAMRQVFQFIAMIISIALTPVITEALGYSVTSLLYGALAIGVIWFMSLGCHENPAAMDKPKPSLLKSVRDIISTPVFWIYGLANATYFAALGLVQSGVPFYVKYHLREGGLAATILLGAVILTAIACVPLWVALLKKYPLIKVWRTSFIVTALSLIPLYFTGTLISAAIAVLAFGFGMSGVSVTMDIVGARILDADSARHNIQREGTFSSLMGVLNKSSGLFSSLAFFLVFSFFGFESGENPGRSPAFASLFITVLFPLAVMLICIAMSFIFKLKKPEDTV